jgi:uncharacterized membrane protein
MNARLLGRQVSFAGVIAAIYAAVTFVLGPLGYSWLQVRLSEALAPLPFLFGFPAVVGLTLGCVVANAFSPVGLYDLLFGPILTLIAAVLSWKLHLGKRLVACAYPVVVNAFGVSIYVAGFFLVPYFVTVVTIGVGEFIAAVLVGYPLLRALEKIPAGVWRR